MNKQEALNKIKELQEYIEGLDKKQEYRPRVKKLNQYWYVDEQGDYNNQSEYWVEHDYWRYLTGNYFLTEEEAREYRNYLKALGEIRDYIKENDLWFKPDYACLSQYKYYIYYSHKLNMWDVSFFTNFHSLFSLPVFQSGGHAQQVIDNCLPQLEIIRKWHEKNL